MDYPVGYYNREAAADNYDEHIFIAGPALQSAELNEIQKRGASKLKAIADSLFKDGDIIRDAVVQVNATTGVTTCSSGAVYLRGAVRGVPTGTFTLPTGTHSIGVYLVESVVDATVDVNLKDPASGQLNYQRSGAARLKVDPVWGYDTDGHAGDFFPIYVADDRVLRPKSPPPTIDGVAQALAKYDRDSTGGSYIIRGMEVSVLPDSGSNQIYSVAEGEARANGQDVLFSSARRLVFNPLADLKLISSEPHVSTGTGSQLVSTTYAPIANITAVTITKQVVETINHGAFSGVSDSLANTSVLSIVAVNQGGTWSGSAFVGGTTYVGGNTDYKLTGNSVDWSAPGSEPATGSTYTVVYQYIATVTADSSNDDGFYVTGAVSGTLILATYNQKLPRLDRICLDETGMLIWLKGVATNYNPRPPLVPSNMLGLATVSQTWRAVRPISNDGVKVVPMQDIARLNTRIDYVLGLVAQQRLESSANTRASGVIKGLLTDPFLNDDLRDAGTAQTGAIIDGILTLPIDVTASQCDSRLAGVSSALTATSGPVIGQTARTGSLLINPYNAFPVPTVPPTVKLKPRIHRWTVTVEPFKSRRTRLMSDLWRWWAPGRLPGNNSGTAFGGAWNIVETNTPETTGFVPPSSTLEQNVIAFEINDFAVGEVLTTVTFDGVAVTPSGHSPADGTGKITGVFTIPANIPAGIKEVIFIGGGGRKARHRYIATGTTVIEPDKVIERPAEDIVSPIAETFTLDKSQHLNGINLWLTAKGTAPVEAQIRTVTNGVPTATVIARARVAASSISTTVATTFAFDKPVFVNAGVEYVIVVVCDDQVASVSIAELGKQDPNTLQWVTAQPYQVGVLLISTDGKTWNPQPDRDLTFQLLGPVFSPTTLTISLGTVAVTNASDIAVRATVQRPTDACDVKFVLTLPDASQVTLGVDQSMILSTPITGNVAISAVLTGTAAASPLLLPDVQLLWGVIGTSGTYYSRYVLSGTNITAKVIIEAYLPGSSSLTVDVKGDEDGSWTTLTGPTAVQLGNGWVELTYTSPTRTDNTTACRLTLTGSSSARPAARNLRMLTQ